MCCARAPPCAQNAKDCVKVLLENNVDVHLANMQGHTARDIGELLKREECVVLIDQYLKLGRDYEYATREVDEFLDDAGRSRAWVEAQQLQGEPGWGFGRVAGSADGPASQLPLLFAFFAAGALFITLPMLALYLLLGRFLVARVADISIRN